MASVVKIKRTVNDGITQDCDVYIGKQMCMGGWNLPESIWHNPFSVKDCFGSAEFACFKYETYLRNRTELLERLHELDGKILGCWCKKNGDEACHGDILIKLLEEQKEKRKTEQYIKRLRDGIVKLSQKNTVLLSKLNMNEKEDKPITSLEFKRVIHKGEACLVDPYHNFYTLDYNLIEKEVGQRKKQYVKKTKKNQIEH